MPHELIIKQHLQITRRNARPAAPGKFEVELTEQIELLRGIRSLTLALTCCRKRERSGSCRHSGVALWLDRFSETDTVPDLPQRHESARQENAVSDEIHCARKSRKCQQ
jgi:hypothetical protein